MSDEELKELGKRVSKIEDDHTIIGPGPEGYPHEREVTEKQAEEDAKEAGKSIKEHLKK